MPIILCGVVVGNVSHCVYKCVTQLFAKHIHMYECIYIRINKLYGLI